MGRSRRKDKELDPEVLEQWEEIWDKQREYLFSESARRLRKELDSKKRSLSSKDGRRGRSCRKAKELGLQDRKRGRRCRKVKELDPEVLKKCEEVPQWPL